MPRSYCGGGYAHHSRVMLRVWAPAARRVEVEVSAERHSLARESGGWWTAAATKIGPGIDYRFLLDGGSSMPDPRSPFQPSGVHGPSRTVDHTAFEWSDAGWQAPPLAAAIVYELHIGTF